MIRRKFNNLLGSPLCCWIRSDIEANHFPAIMAHNNKYKRYSKTNRWYDQKIHSYHICPMILNERLPCL